MREAGWKDRIQLMLGRLKAVRVSGDSMRPTLGNNDVVLVAPAAGIAIGDIVLAGHPFKQSVTVLKRVTAIDESGRAELRGDDPQGSTDSRSFGRIPLKEINWRVVARLKRGQ